jgi:hypothetical protein
MSLTGELNQPEGVNCADDYTNPLCGAKNFKGTWTLTGGGTGALTNLRGNGTLTWDGCDADHPFPACLPKYEGKIIFAGGMPTATATAASADGAINGAATDAALSTNRVFIPFVSQ